MTLIAAMPVNGSYRTKRTGLGIEERRCRVYAPEALVRVGMLSAFYPTLKGGAESSLNVLIDALQRSGIELVILTLDQRPAASTAYRSVTRVPGRLKILGHPVLDSLIARRLSRILRRESMDVLCVNDTYSYLAASRAVRDGGPPLLACYHNNVGIPHREFGPNPIVARWLDRRERHLLSRLSACHRVLANSDYIAKRLVEHGVERSKVVRVYIGGPIAVWGTEPYPKLEGPVRIAAAGRIQEHKGFQDLIEAIPLLVGWGLDVNAVIAGSGPYAGKLRKMISQHAVAGRVKLVGAVTNDQVLELFDDSHVVVVPARTPEPFGRTAVEAMSRARPVVVSAVGGLVEVVEHDETGLHVPPAQPAAIARAIQGIVGDFRLAARMGFRAQQSARRRFAGETIAKQFASICEHAAYQPHHTPRS